MALRRPESSCESLWVHCDSWVYLDPRSFNRGDLENVWRTNYPQVTNRLLTAQEHREIHREPMENQGISSTLRGLGELMENQGVLKNKRDTVYPLYTHIDCRGIPISLEWGEHMREPLYPLGVPWVPLRARETPRDT